MPRPLNAFEILRKSITEHDPVKIFACFSGGHDSLVSTHLTMSQADRYDVPFEVLHINTGIGLETTRRFARQTCEDFGWPLLELHAKDDCGQDYEEIVREHGFPGPAMHIRMYNRLKERCIELALRKAKEGYSRMRRALFVTGIRAEESQIRAGYNRVESKVKAQIWVNPCYRWTGQDCYDYQQRHDLPTNPVYDVIGMSGECLCGAYAHQGELDLVRMVEPETADRIERLNAETTEAGFPWDWEHPGPPKRWQLEKEGQQSLFRPLCAGCGKTDAPAKAAA